MSFGPLAGPLVPSVKSFVNVPRPCSPCLRTFGMLTTNVWPCSCTHAPSWTSTIFASTSSCGQILPHSKFSQVPTPCRKTTVILWLAEHRESVRPIICSRPGRARRTTAISQWSLPQPRQSTHSRRNSHRNSRRSPRCATDSTDVAENI